MIDQAPLKTNYQVMLKIFLGIVGGLFLFMGAMYYLMTQQPLVAKPDAGHLQTIIAVLSILVLGASFVVKPMILKKSKGGIPGNDVKEALKPLMSALFVSWGLCEAAVLTPAVMAMSGNNPHDLILAMVLGIVGFGFHFPRYSDWQNFAQGN